MHIFHIVIAIGTAISRRGCFQRRCRRRGCFQRRCRRRRSRCCSKGNE